MRCPKCDSPLDLVGDVIEYHGALNLQCTEERCGWEGPLPGEVLHRIRELIDNLPQSMMEEKPVEPKWCIPVAGTPVGAGS